MPRPHLPKAEDVAGLARLLRAEGFASFCIETTPDGHVSITVGKGEGGENVTPLEKWKAGRAAS
ncbi:MAG: hypothetical protein RLN94_13370 [Roseovarius sp.]|uniref:hypothetical protein n=1 Tax=Roseovarius sp. TaxID=1486281 RepID=UPI0032EEB0AA